MIQALAYDFCTANKTQLQEATVTIREWHSVLKKRSLYATLALSCSLSHIIILISYLEATVTRTAATTDKFKVSAKTPHTNRTFLTKLTVCNF
jgi:hypothetical protein